MVKLAKLNHRRASPASAQSHRKFPRCQPPTTQIKRRQSRLILAMRGRREPLVSDLRISLLVGKKVSAYMWATVMGRGRWTDRLNWYVKHSWRQQRKDVGRHDGCGKILNIHLIENKWISTFRKSLQYPHMKYRHLRGSHLKECWVENMVTTDLMNMTCKSLVSEQNTV